ncbi:hypothetical protein BJ878DRAFT_431541, partial [Calycina marina]
IRGNLSKGKTILLYSIIDTLKETSNATSTFGSCLLSYFFCQATNLRINSTTAILKG